jgi:hypothetical protein
MHVLLILVLFGDPSGADAAKAVGTELAELGGTTVHVVVGPEALAQLAGKGVKEADLLGSPVIANHLTASDPDLVVIRLDRRADGGDQLIESRVWYDGHSDSHVAISGHGGDPTASAVSGIIQVLGTRLPLSPGQPANVEGGQLAHLAEHNDWQGIRDSMRDKASKDPRQFYYLVLAEVRLGLIDEARRDVAAMATAHGAHFLVAAARSLLPPPESAPQAGAPKAGATDAPAARPDPGAPGPQATKPPPDVKDSNELRDPPTTQDPGGNVLR